MLKFILALLQAIFGALLSPLRSLGWEPKPRAADVAAAAVEAVRADPIEMPPPVPREPTPMADLVLAHARKRLFTHERHPELVPLPPAIEAWIELLDGRQLGDIIGSQGMPLQRHINRGLAGSIASGPCNLPPVLPHAVPTQTKRGATGGTTASREQRIADTLEDLGLVFDRSYSPRPR